MPILKNKPQRMYALMLAFTCLLLGTIWVVKKRDNTAEAAKVVVEQAIAYNIVTSEQQKNQSTDVETTPEKAEHILNLAFRIGSEIGYPETVQAIALQETHAGEFGNGVGDAHEKVGLRSYGIMQVKVATARFVFHNYHQLFDQYFPGRILRRIPDEEIIVLLLTDDEANITIGAYNFELMLKMMNYDWAAALVAYNGGPGFAKDYIKHNTAARFKYVKSIKNWIKTVVRPHNEKHNTK